VRHRAFLFEPAARDPQRMIRPFEEAKDRYVPHFAVNTGLVTSAFFGCVMDPGPASPAGTAFAAR
jgi:hypothetical protein